jgi:hypothetical protein
MKKLTFLTFLLLISNILQAEEFKLSCNILKVMEFSTGSSEKSNTTEIYTVTDLGSRKFIIPTSDEFPSVSTVKKTNSITVTDESDNNKWDITNVSKNEQGDLSTVSIRIDRNTGKIFYSFLFERLNGSFITTKGRGDCEKVNLTKKKF